MPTFRNPLSVPSSRAGGFFINLPLKMEPMEGSETSAFRTQTPGNYPKENLLQCLTDFQSFVSLTVCQHKLHWNKCSYKHKKNAYVYVQDVDKVSNVERYNKKMACKKNLANDD